MEDEGFDNFLFKIKIIAFLREFKGQISGRKVEEYVIGADSMEDFGEKVWAKVKPHVKREVLFDGDNYSFSSEDPVQEDLDK